MSEVTFVAFDVETTGLDAGCSRIVEVGAVSFNRESVFEEYHQLINPGCPIPREITAIHGITDAEVATCPCIIEVLPQLIEFFGSSVLVAHNASFDASFLDAAFAEAGTEPPPNSIFCTVTLARSVFPGLPDYKLSTLVRRLGIPEGRHHRALADAIHCAEVFRRCLDRIENQGGTARMYDFIQRHGPPLRFGTATARLMETIEQALQSGTSLRMEYRDARGTVTIRDITPTSIAGRGRNTKIVAYCHVRNDKRTFRLDCIKRIF